MAQEQNHEFWMDKIFRTAISTANGTFVDVGANLGQTMLKILSINPQQAYVGFEPQVMCCAQLTQFITNRRLNNCRVLPIGLSSENAVLEILTRSGARVTLIKSVIMA